MDRSREGAPARIRWAIGLVISLIGGSFCFPGAAQAISALPLEYVFETVAYPGADASGVAGVRSDGTVIGWFTVLDPNSPPPPLFEPSVVLDRGFFSYDGTAYDRFEIASASGDPDARLEGANGRGDLWGYLDGRSTGFVVVDGVFREVAYPDFDASFVTGIADDGRIFGVRSNRDPYADPNDLLQIAVDPGVFELGLDGVFRDVVIPGGGIPNGMRDDGLLFGTGLGGEAFLFDGIAVEVVDPPGEEEFTLIHGVTDSGTILGTQFDSDLRSKRFIQVGGDFVPLRGPPGATSFNVTGVNGDGVWWGGGVGGDVSGAFVARPIPEPSMSFLLSLGLAVLAGLRRSINA